MRNLKSCLCILILVFCSCTGITDPKKLGQNRMSDNNVPALTLRLLRDMPSANGGIFPWSAFDLHESVAPKGLKLEVEGVDFKKTTTTAYLLIRVNSNSHHVVCTTADSKNKTPEGLIEQLQRAGFEVVISNRKKAEDLLYVKGWNTSQ